MNKGKKKKRGEKLKLFCELLKLNKLAELLLFCFPCFHYLVKLKYKHSNLHGLLLIKCMQRVSVFSVDPS